MMRIGSIEKDVWQTKKDNDRIIELLVQQNELLERIANDLEQEQEPYIIAKEDS